MKEIPFSSDLAIQQADFVIKNVSVEQGINRIKNDAHAEQWEPWEVEVAVNRLMDEGEYCEKRPAFYMNNMRYGVVLAVGEKCNCRVGDQIMFSFKNSSRWYSFWKDTVPKEQTSLNKCNPESKVYIFDGKEDVLAVSQDSVIHIVPDNAIPLSII